MHKRYQSYNHETPWHGHFPQMEHDLKTRIEDCYTMFTPNIEPLNRVVLEMKICKVINYINPVTFGCCQLGLREHDLEQFGKGSPNNFTCLRKNLLALRFQGRCFIYTPKGGPVLSPGHYLRNFCTRHIMLNTKYDIWAIALSEMKSIQVGYYINLYKSCVPWRVAMDMI